MKHTLFFLLLISTEQSFFAQQKQPKPNLTAAIIDTNFKDTLSFTKQWAYPWYINIDENGHIENTEGDSLVSADTARLYYTADCWTNHQGKHQVRYCDAILSNDTIRLDFQAELPAYASGLTLHIINNQMFWSNFSANYPVFTKDEKLFWTITKQKLILDKADYKIGDMIKGYVNVEFTETSIVPKGKTTNKQFYFKGYFKTLLKKDSIGPAE